MISKILSSIKYLAMQGLAYEVIEMKPSCSYYEMKIKHFLNADMRDWLKNGEKVHICINTE